MFDIEPDRQPDRQPREPRTYRVPFSSPPPKPRSWWGTGAGQFALIVMLIGAIVIVLGLAGVIGPESL